MSDTTLSTTGQDGPESRRDIGFAVGIVLILAVLFLPIPTFLIDLGLAFSIALSVLILMVALWIQKPLDFSSFPTILLIATMLRLSLNIATTRVILANGHEGLNAAGYIINGFSQFVMSGDFVIGIIVFAIPDHGELSRHHQGRDPDRGGRSQVHPRCHPGQADGHRRGPVRGADQRQGSPNAGAASWRRKAPSSAPWTVHPSSFAATPSRA